MRSFFFSAALALGGLGTGAALAQTIETIAVTRLAEPITLDGRLAEPAWKNAARRRNPGRPTRRTPG